MFISCFHGSSRVTLRADTREEAEAKLAMLRDEKAQLDALMESVKLSNQRPCLHSNEIRSYEQWQRVKAAFDAHYAELKTWTPYAQVLMEQWNETHHLKANLDDMSVGGSFGVSYGFDVQEIE